MSLSHSVIKAQAIQWQPGGVNADPRPASGPTPVAPPPAPAAPLDLDAAQQSLLTAAISQSQEILEKARAQAAELLARAQAQADEVTQAAQRAGAEAAEAEAAHLLAAAQGVYDEVRIWHDHLAGQSESIVLELVVQIAQTLFSPGVTLAPEVLQAAFARALGEAKPLGSLRIHIHPEDARLLGAHWPEQQSVQLGQRLELVPDPSIRRGGCLVEGDFGLVDARIETQLQLVTETLAQAAPPLNEMKVDAGS